MKSISKIQYITQAKSTQQIIEEVENVLCGGCKWIQLRMKESEISEITKTATILKELCATHNAIFLINDSIEVCKSVDADGVHLGKMDVSTQQARAELGFDKIIGRTANTLEDIIALESEAIDYIGLGPLRFTTTKKLLSPTIGIEGYQQIFQQYKPKFPIVAVGSVTLDDIQPLLDAGLHGAAISGAIFHATDPIAATKEFMELAEV
ncbi:MAG: thiamine phosphate synthase [Rikenellaceae bacterium]